MLISALALDLGGLSNADAVSGLKDALTQGSATGMAKKVFGLLGK